MKQKLSLVSTALFFLLILLSYQNCGVQQEGSLFKAATYSTLPYEMSVDQLAYMSCAEQNGVANDHGVFFTFRGGAYGDQAGLRITEDFLYETRRLTDSRRMDVLFEDPATAMSRLQFSLRSQSNLGIFVNADSGTGVEEIDFDYIFGDFGTDAMSASLLTTYNGRYMNYWPPAGVNKDAYFEGSLVFNSSEALAEQVRRVIAQGSLLTFAYADLAKPENLRSFSLYEDYEEGEEPVVPANEAIGVGLKLAFKQPHVFNWGYAGVADATMPKRVLQSVSERDLSDPNRVVPSQWSCPNTLQFRIIFPEDIWKAGSPTDPSDDNNFEPNPGAAGLLCPQRSDSHVENSANPELLAIVRRSLPVSDWYVNIAHQCIIPKRYTKGSCYGIDQGTNDTRSPNYNVSMRCNPAINTVDAQVCSHFMSICYKP